MLLHNNSHFLSVYTRYFTMSNGPLTMGTSEKMTGIIMQSLAKPDVVKELTRQINKRIHNIGEGVSAAKTSVDKVNERVTSVEADFDSFKKTMAKEMQDLRGDGAAPARASASGSASASSTAPARGTWQARIFHVRGWSPYGSAPGTKLSRVEANSLINQIKCIMRLGHNQQIRWLAPCAGSSTSSGECGGAECSLE